jgi:hypothetical protein
MNKRKIFIGLLAFVILFTISVGLSVAQEAEPSGITAYEGELALTESFTYQGSLTVNGSPANGLYDFAVTIWNAETGGTEISACQALEDQVVEGGLFTIHCIPANPMNSVFNGEPRWLQVWVKSDSDTGYNTLPRQPISAAPYAWSLRPGAVISDTVTSGGVFSVAAKDATMATFGASLGRVMTYTKAGIYAYSNAESGTGVVGSAAEGPGTNVGVRGVSYDSNGWGVRGAAMATSGATVGVYGSATSPDGFGGFFINHYDGAYEADSLFAQRNVGNGNALYAEFDGDQGRAILAENNSLSGPGVSALSQKGIGVYGKTNDTDHDYGFYTPDNLYSYNIHTAAADMQIVQNAGSEALDVGDVAVFYGIGTPLTEGGPQIVQVAKAAQANDTAVAGVVFSRYNIDILNMQPEEIGAETEITPAGSVQPGEYLLLVVRGPAQVKANALGSPIHVGDLLSASDMAGHAARTAKVAINGVEIAPPGTVFAKALQDLESGESLIYVFVTLD